MSICKHIKHGIFGIVYVEILVVQTVAAAALGVLGPFPLKFGAKKCNCLFKFEVHHNKTGSGKPKLIKK